MFKIPQANSELRDRESDIADVPPVDALLDILIALLDKASNDLRNLANTVFGMLSSAFSPSSIQHLVAVRCRRYVTYNT